MISLGSPSTGSSSSEGLGFAPPSSWGRSATGKKGSRRAMLPPFQLDKTGKDSLPRASPSGAGGVAEGGGQIDAAAARALVRTKVRASSAFLRVGQRQAHLDRPAHTAKQKLVRALGFFYHLSLAVLFTTFTELLLGDFGHDFSKTAAFLG